MIALFEGVLERRVVVERIVSSLALGLAVLAFVFVPAGDADRVDASAGSCSPARPHASGSFPDTILSDGLTRNYLLYIPASYVGDTAVPLVLNLHLMSSNAQAQADLTGLPAKADQEGFIAVMPQAAEDTSPLSRAWDYAGLSDLAFISALLDELQGELCVDDHRVFAMGLSSGAFMSVRLGCSLSNRVAAIAPVSGVYFPPRSPESGEAPGCPSEGPVPIIAFHAIDDSILPFLGGTALFGDTVRSIPDEIMPDWAQHNGCVTVPKQQQVTESMLLTYYVGCSDGADTQLYALDTGGHSWPDVATDLIWEFFVDHPNTSSPAVGGVAQLSSLDDAPVGSPGSRSAQGSGNAGLGGRLLFGLGGSMLAAAALAAAVKYLRRHRDART